MCMKAKLRNFGLFSINKKTDFCIHLTLCRWMLKVVMRLKLGFRLSIYQTWKGFRNIFYSSVHLLPLGRIQTYLDVFVGLIKKNNKEHLEYISLFWKGILLKISLSKLSKLQVLKCHRALITVLIGCISIWGEEGNIMKKI